MKCFLVSSQNDTVPSLLTAALKPNQFSAKIFRFQYLIRFSIYCLLATEINVQKIVIDQTPKTCTVKTYLQLT